MGREVYHNDQSSFTNGHSNSHQMKMSTFNTHAGVLLLLMIITIRVWPIPHRAWVSIRSNTNSRFPWTASVACFTSSLQTRTALARKGKSQDYPFDEDVLAGTFCTGSVCTAILEALSQCGNHPIRELKRHHVTQVANHTAQITSARNDRHGQFWPERCSNKPFVKRLGITST